MLQWLRRRTRPIKPALIASVAFVAILCIWMLVASNRQHTAMSEEDIPPYEETAARPARVEPAPLSLADSKAAEIMQSTTPKISTVADDLSKLADIVADLNEQQTVLNGARLGFELQRTGIILLVQVHDRHIYLRQTIASLRQVRFIDSVLVIFSHDFYSKEIFDTIKDIEFMPVMQIFYPMALQLFPNRFPGSDPRDCPRDMTKESAAEIGCLNAQHPDKYGHYREARFVQTKHHWFWKLNHVYDDLKVTKNFQGTVVLLEDDHYLVPDFIYMLRKMATMKNSLCPECNLFSLGNYRNTFLVDPAGEVVSSKFVSSKHNMAMAFNRTLFELIKARAKEFCTYDDYNWDWTLHFLGYQHIPGDLTTLVPHLTRAFHMGKCGIHHQVQDDCNPADQVHMFEQQIREREAHLFPGTISQGKWSADISMPAIKPTENGGWGDVRDHELCLSFA